MRHVCNLNQTQQTSQNQNLIITTNNKITPNFVITYGFKMTGPEKNRGAARDLTVDPDFVMREANSSPQGIKKSGGNKITSTEKKNKPTPNEMTPPMWRL